MDEADGAPERAGIVVALGQPLTAMSSTWDSEVGSSGNASAHAAVSLRNFQGLDRYCPLRLHGFLTVQSVFFHVLLRLSIVPWRLTNSS